MYRRTFFLAYLLLSDIVLHMCAKNKLLTENIQISKLKKNNQGQNNIQSTQEEIVTMTTEYTDPQEELVSYVAKMNTKRRSVIDVNKKIVEQNVYNGIKGETKSKATMETISGVVNQNTTEQNEYGVIKGGATEQNVSGIIKGEDTKKNVSDVVKGEATEQKVSGLLKGEETTQNESDLVKGECAEQIAIDVVNGEVKQHNAADIIEGEAKEQSVSKVVNGEAKQQSVSRLVKECPRKPGFVGPNKELTNEQIKKHTIKHNYKEFNMIKTLKKEDAVGNIIKTFTGLGTSTGMVSLNKVNDNKISFGKEFVVSKTQKKKRNLHGSYVIIETSRKAANQATDKQYQYIKDPNDIDNLHLRLERASLKGKIQWAHPGSKDVVEPPTHSSRKGTHGKIDAKRDECDSEKEIIETYKDPVTLPDNVSYVRKRCQISKCIIVH